MQRITRIRLCLCSSGGFLFISAISFQPAFQTHTDFGVSIAWVAGILFGYGGFSAYPLGVGRTKETS